MSAQNHIRNPFELALEQLAGAFSLPQMATPRRLAAPTVRKIGAQDLWASLREGIGDFSAARDDVLFIGLIYPIAGLVLAQAILDQDLLPLIFPMAAGFALLGPLAAVGLYEISRRREHGKPVNWADALGVFKSPALGSIFTLGLAMVGLFLLWLAAAYGLYQNTVKPIAGATIGDFLQVVFTTPQGRTMIVAGFAIGFVFAVVALAVSVVSFPLLLDRDIGVVEAVRTSIQTVKTNAGPMALWGLVVALALAVGSIPALFGLIFVVPILGHATWRLYRKLIA